MPINRRPQQHFIAQAAQAYSLCLRLALREYKPFVGSPESDDL